MSVATDQRIHLWPLLRNILRFMPQMGHTLAGMVGLALSKPEKVNSIGLLLEKQARQRPAAPALRAGDRTYSYSQFNAEANRFAHWLAGQGIGRGDTVAVMLENRPEALFAVAGIVKIGAIASMINTSQRGHVLVHSLTLVRPKLVIVGEELTDALQEVHAEVAGGDDLPCAFLPDDSDASAPAGWTDLPGELARQSITDPPVTATITLGTPCFYIFTSGTTGLPKASVMSHLRWMKGMFGVGRAAVRIRPDDVFYCPLPLYHNNALTLAWGTAVGGGACLALARRFSASRFWDEIRACDATVFCYIGELCRYLLNQPAGAGDRYHRVRACLGNGLRPDIWNEFKERFGIDHICEFYGASEGNLAFVNGFNMDRTAGFCPLSFAVVEYDVDADAPVRGADGHMKRVQPGGCGLLICEVTERATFDGYTDKSASEKKLFRDVFAAGDCWFNSGDLVRDQGFMHIQFVDRLGDTFRWKGENVATTEVEAAINGYPGVEHSVAYGVEIPGTDGRAGMACITIAGDTGAFDFAALARHLKAALPAYAVPLFLRCRAEQEVTGTFKYRKVELKKEAFHPEQVADPLYVLLPGTDAYQPLDLSLHARIMQGEIRF